METTFVLHLLQFFIASQALNSASNFYQLSALDIKGQNVSFQGFKGMVLLIVNVATYCGYTQSHYKQLVKTQEILGHKKFSIIGFPCNQFGGQEPDTEEEILEFVETIYRVNFPLFAKVNVTGPNTHPVYQYLKAQSGQEPNWNFWKYLVDHKGNVLENWGPDTSVEDSFDRIEEAIQAADNDKWKTEHDDKEEL